MIYFAKSNKLLATHQAYFELIENAHNLLVSYKIFAISGKDSGAVFSWTKETLAITLSEGLKSKYKKFQEACETLKIDLYSAADPVEKLEQQILDLKLFQNFEGKINFAHVLGILNYGNEVFTDKLRRFSLLPDLDKKFIPEFMSAAFAELWFNKCIHPNIRRPVEQYFYGLLSNMNYQHFSSGSQLRDLVEKFFPKQQAALYIIGGCPDNFAGVLAGEENSITNEELGNREYAQLLRQRLNTAKSVTEYCAPFLTIKCFPNGFFIRKTGQSQINHWMTDEDRKYAHLSLGERSELRWERTITKENVGKILANYYHKEVRDNDNWILDKNYPSLIVVTSTFHVYKTALEIERFFFKKNIGPESQPHNVVIIGDEPFYELMSHADDTINKELKKSPGINSVDQLKLIRMKKIKNFMFEIFKHALDKNSLK